MKSGTGIIIRFLWSTWCMTESKHRISLVNVRFIWWRYPPRTLKMLHKIKIALEWNALNRNNNNHRNLCANRSTDSEYLCSNEVWLRCIWNVFLLPKKDYNKRSWLAWIRDVVEKMHSYQKHNRVTVYERCINIIFFFGRSFWKLDEP